MVRLPPEIARFVGDDSAPDVLASAARSARRGDLFPLRASNKTPTIANPHPKTSKERGECTGQLGHGVHDASRNPDKVRRIFGGRPDANIGGTTTDCLVVDLDLNHRGAVVDELPPTSVHKIGRGNRSPRSGRRPTPAHPLCIDFAVSLGQVVLSSTRAGSCGCTKIIAPRSTSGFGRMHSGTS